MKLWLGFVTRSEATEKEARYPLKSLVGLDGDDDNDDVNVHADVPKPFLLTSVFNSCNTMASNLDSLT